MVHVKNVLIAVAAVSLLHTNVTRQWIVLDIFNRNQTPESNKKKSWIGIKVIGTI